MITPKEIRQKAEKSFFKIVSSQLRSESLFPWVIPSNKQITGNNYSDWKNDLLPLFQQSKQVKPKGYTVIWKEKKINGSVQSVPSKIYFDNLDDFLFFIDKEGDYKKIIDAKERIVAEFPNIEGWVNDNPSILLEFFEVWDDLIKVCKYFVAHSSPYNYYIRELPIEVHSKFIEQSSGLLTKLLDRLLPDEQVNRRATDFATRYGLKKANIYTQIRILDEELKSSLGYDECSLTLEDAAWLRWLPEKVFIIENQVCYLTFPKVKNSVAIFGSGFKSRLSKHLPWLENTRLICWFDLDTAGFEMLNMIRQHYPIAESLLMDEDTYFNFRNFAVTNNSKRKELPLLMPSEREMYEFLLTNNRRLEQERISQQFIYRKLEG
ncbi:hypothetical protein CJD36_021915 [Flavipsychrobacter stenotrophus]|uniref:Wadjet protein JetD C-terminal domain-containing protein n=1 Tax=Flavipsychrobacter stenotrophus TaxID=2077091 RepID=A0A2S7SPU3_9BACT|nr:Wadjet anti-phage system protein JetD domain-containing protein [Flavipsychrobacter stenotrophus]PQJ08923.1 hypothetical protein CJD36_021915 [Flavipsychrobacter stenotrophus]